jgi:TatD DNase family protein
MFIDSHCHLDRLATDSFAGSLDAALAAAREAGVGKFLCVAINSSNLATVREIAGRYADVWATAGIHPSDEDGQEFTVEELIAVASAPRIVAIGETGLDYYRCSGDMAWQRDRFRRHIQAAVALDKPLVIHCREASEDLLTIMQQEGADRVGGIMHCFVDTWEVAERAMAMGFYISFSGIVTFPKATQVKEVAQRVPLDRVLIETDSPWLAPHPWRGKANHPALLPYIAAGIAELRGTDVATIAKATSENFERLIFNRHCQGAVATQ